MMEPNSKPVAAGGVVRNPDVRPLVGVPGQTLQAIDGIPEALPHSWVMNRRYFDALAETGAVPVQVHAQRAANVCGDHCCARGIHPLT